MGTKNRGFAAMSKAQRSSIARLGGITAHKKGTAHEFTSQEAQTAGRKGGLVSGKSRRRRSVQQVTTIQIPT